MAQVTRPSRVLRLIPALQPGRIRAVQILAGYMPRKTEWIHHAFESCAIGLVVSGAGSYRVDNGPSRRIGPSSLFAVHPGPTFHYGPAKGTTWEEYHVVVIGPGARRWIETGWIFTDGAVHQMAEVSALVERFRELLRTLSRGGPGDADRAVLAAERLLLEAYYGRSSVRPSTALKKSTDAVLAYCHQHFARPIDFKALAARNAMSYSHLRQRLRRLTGSAPQAYVTRLRCEAARALLSDTDLAIKEIAARIGIEDPFAFSRTFKRCVGSSPLQYRRQVAPWSLTAVIVNPI
jgi:AraC-like DNA-binding protein